MTMQTTPIPPLAQDHISWGLIEFQVTDLGRAISFWTQTLGLQIRDQKEGTVFLGTKEKTLFAFRGGATKPVQARYRGMYHVAIGVPNQAEFSRMLARLIALKIPNSPTDHLLSKSIYLADPDGLEIELVLETPDRFGRFGDMSKGLMLYDASGAPHSGRAPLDIAAELAFATDADVTSPLSADAFLAHMHFKVSDLDSASKWYAGIGFEPSLMIPAFGFADMGAGTPLTHRLAMNIWAGPNLPPAPDDMARLTRYSLHARGETVLKNARGLTPSDAGLVGHDPSGTALTLLPA